MSDSACCTFLDWDTHFFGVRIGQVNSSRLTSENTAEVLRWAARKDIDCLYLLCDSDHAPSISAAERNGFHLVDVRLTFEHDLREVRQLSNSTCRTAEERDIPALKAIAGESFLLSRYYFDERFTESQSRALYETWIEKSCNGYADKVFVTGSPGEPKGFISGHLDDGNVGSIDLVGVGKEARGQGIATSLINYALDWFVEQRVQWATVVTQGRNIGAQRLYQRTGFVTKDVKLWYHRWFN